MSKETKIIETPLKYQGKWIAWDKDHIKIIASGDEMVEVENQASQITGDYWLDKVPSNKKHFGGSATLQ